MKTVNVYCQAETQFSIFVVWLAMTLLASQKEFFPTELDDQLLFHFLRFFPFLLKFLTNTVLHAFIFCRSQKSNHDGINEAVALVSDNIPLVYRLSVKRIPRVVHTAKLLQSRSDCRNCGKCFDQQ